MNENQNLQNQQDLQNSNDLQNSQNHSINKVNTQKPTSRKSGNTKLQKEIAASRKRLDVLLAEKDSNMLHIAKLQADIAALRQANKNIDRAIPEVKKEISALMFHPEDTTKFTKVVDALAGVEVSPVEILELVLRSDFETLDAVLQNSKTKDRNKK